MKHTYRYTTKSGEAKTLESTMNIAWYCTANGMKSKTKEGLEAALRAEAMRNYNYHKKCGYDEEFSKITGKYAKETFKDFLKETRKAGEARCAELIDAMAELTEVKE